MDFIFISKVIIIIALYFLTNFAYRKIKWNESTANKKEIILVYAIVIITIIPLSFAVIGLGFIIIPNGLFNYLEQETYVEQIIIVFGFIIIFFTIRIMWDKKEKEKKKNQELISNQANEIRYLETELKKYTDNKSQSTWMKNDG